MAPKSKAKAAAANAAPPTKDLFVISMKDQVVFPAIRSTVVLTQEMFAKLTEYCETHNTNIIGCVAQRPAGDSQPEGDGLYMVGTYGKLMSQRQETRKAGGKEETVTRVSIEGKGRFQVTEYTQKEPYRLANISLLSEQETGANAAEMKTLRESVQKSVMELVEQSNNQQQGGQPNPLGNFLGGGGKQQIKWPASASLLADMVGAGVGKLSTPERQQVLEELDVKKRLELVITLLGRMGEAVKITKELNTNIQKRQEAEMRNMIIQRQIGELQQELRKMKGQAEPEEGERDPEWDDDMEDEEDDLANVKEMLKKANLPEDAKKIALRELKRLQNIQPQHPEYMNCRTYLDLLASMPWQKSTEDSDDLKKAREVLDKDHYGLEKVKKRILEFLAVRKLRSDMKGPILCLHGPPGVGKTSLGRSVARALGRRFHRIALGGVRDEAELRGHRRTYIGSMPGVIIEALRATNTNNPVVLLDEIDKLAGNSNQGNPSGALLEILDPEQNHTFKDHYMNTPFNLSKILFLATCNDAGLIDRALLDRMELINLTGYTVEEKLSIAHQYLLPKQRRAHALERDDPSSLSHAASLEESLKAAEDREREDSVKPKSEKEKALAAKKLAEEEAKQKELEAQAAAGPEEPLLEITPEAIKEIIRKWTTEGGVRTLERQMATVCRFGALKIANSMSNDSLTGQQIAGLGSTNTGQTQEITTIIKEAEDALAECGPIESTTKSGAKVGKVFVDVKHLPYILGMELVEPDIAERLTVGVAMGLSVSQIGGSLLFIEATKVPGHGQLIVTGNLRDVMRESVRTALSLLRSKVHNSVMDAGGYPELELVSGDSGGTSDGQIPVQAAAGLGASAPIFEGTNSKYVDPVEILTGMQRSRKDSKDLFGTVDLHVHFPAGAIPKDGPSAGVAITLALTSLFLNKPMRSDTAVTGEISLRGHVLPVGGIKDKVLAAHRAGLRHVLIPEKNRKDVKEDLTESILNDIEIHYCKHVDEAMEWAFAPGASDYVPRLDGVSDAGGTARASSVAKPPKSAM